MSLFWLTYKNGKEITVFIQPAASLVHARLKGALAGCDDGTFAEGHELDTKTGKKIPKTQLEKPLSQKEAKRLLDRL